MAVHPRTAREMSKVIDFSYEGLVRSWIQDAMNRSAMLVFMVDDYTNVHTKHRPTETNPTVVSHKATLLLKRFDDVKAIPVEGLQQTHNPDGVDSKLLVKFLLEKMSTLSLIFAASMPSWIKERFFDPEAERHRLSVHDYQEFENIRVMRSMDHSFLIDSLELPLKSYSNFFEAVQHALDMGLAEYLKKFIIINPGDWPAQFYLRQIVNQPESPIEMQHIVPFIGALHVSLNDRENPVPTFIPFFKMLYKAMFGEKRILADHPQPWRISLVSELAYGSWTLVRDSLLQFFGKSKDVQVLTLINLLDNYLPLVLTIYSTIFKGNNLDQYMDAMLRAWVMFFVFKRHHYDKAPLVWLSNILYWKTTNHPLYGVLTTHLQTVDEYGIENFHSILRAQTNVINTPDEITRKAREISATKDILREFKTQFVPPRTATFSHNQLKELKVKGAHFILETFKSINDNPNQAKMLPRAPRQQKNVTRWSLPQIFGDVIATNKVLPLGFSALGNEPDPTR